MGDQHYIGQNFYGLREGLGVLVDLTPGQEFIYEGGFNKGYRHGLGRMIQKTLGGTKTVEGSFVNDAACGAFISIHDDKSWRDNY